MKKIALGILIGIVVLALSGVVTACMVIPVADQARNKAMAPEKSPAIVEGWSVNVPPDVPVTELEKVVFIHYKKNFAKPTECNDDGACQGWEREIPDCGDCVAPPPEEESACYAFIMRNVRWRWTEDYVVSPSLDQSVIDTSANTWDGQVAFDIFADVSRVGVPPWNEYDGNNSISFGDYPDPNVIAVTAIWWSPRYKAIVEYDILFNDTDFTWGDATTCTPETECNVMDLQNIATHEFGHAAGLADLDDAACVEETMWWLSHYGETKKRTLEAGDITGVKELYK